MRWRCSRRAAVRAPAAARLDFWRCCPCTWTTRRRVAATPLASPPTPICVCMRMDVSEFVSLYVSLYCMCPYMCPYVCPYMDVSEFACMLVHVCTREYVCNRARIRAYRNSTYKGTSKRIVKVTCKDTYKGTCNPLASQPTTVCVCMHLWMYAFMYEHACTMIHTHLLS